MTVDNSIIDNSNGAFLYESNHINSKTYTGFSLDISDNVSIDSLDLNEYSKRDYYEIIVGGIIDENVQIIDKGTGYGSIVENIKYSNDTYLKDNIKDINVYPYIYNTISVDTDNNYTYDIEVIKCKIGISDDYAIESIKVTTAYDSITN